MTPLATVVLDSEDLAYFRSILSNDEILNSQAPEELASFNQDWMKKYRGQSNLILLPNSTDKVSKIMKYCNDKKLAVVPQGGNTDLVGASVPVFDEIVLSLRNMNKVRDFDPVSGTFKCDAGVVMRVRINFYDHDHIFPLDLPSRNNCQVGGVVSTNAGGLNFFKIWVSTGNVLGLEVVLPNGEIISNINALRKDNTGYDLKQLFIGAEGTIGVVTGVSIVAAAKPKSLECRIFLVLRISIPFRNYLSRLKSELSEILSAF
ncbi:BGN_3a_G0013610.mRNA.1.CDS.1 [Saccharomyces cerevisiae]|nr:BGN_3a_G0013610.mRNA.1.CDS.1 [Saccharomyces cerevisiae]CAI7095564.1 BGN_3a_G0013610.mRNA.1.CDS.1 [Saccharomyces cerevisiae]